jgi:hypothetical protein
LRLRLTGSQEAEVWEREAHVAANIVEQLRQAVRSWRLRLSHKRPPGGYLAFVLAAVAAMIAAPYGEELWRCAAARNP